MFCRVFFWFSHLVVPLQLHADQSLQWLCPLHRLNQMKTHPVFLVTQKKVDLKEWTIPFQQLNQKPNS